MSTSTDPKVVFVEYITSLASKSIASEKSPFVQIISVMAFTVNSVVIKYTVTFYSNATSNTASVVSTFQTSMKNKIENGQFIQSLRNSSNVYKYATVAVSGFNVTSFVSINVKPTASPTSTPTNKDSSSKNNKRIVLIASVSAAAGVLFILFLIAFKVYHGSRGDIINGKVKYTHSHHHHNEHLKVLPIDASAEEYMDLERIRQNSARRNSDLVVVDTNNTSMNNNNQTTILENNHNNHRRHHHHNVNNVNNDNSSPTKKNVFPSEPMVVVSNRKVNFDKANSTRFVVGESSSMKKYIDNNGVEEFEMNRVHAFASIDDNDDTSMVDGGANVFVGDNLPSSDVENVVTYIDNSVVDLQQQTILI